MAVIPSPTLVAAPDQPQTVAVPVANNLNTAPQPVMTRPLAPSPNPQGLRNTTSSTTI